MLQDKQRNTRYPTPLERGPGLARLEQDPYMAPYLDTIARRAAHARSIEERLTEKKVSLEDFASGHEFFGLHRTSDGWVFREWAPAATCIELIGDFCDWNEHKAIPLKKTTDPGVWSATIPPTTISHGSKYRLKMHWKGGAGDRIPAYARRVVQDPGLGIFNAEAWFPEHPYRWKNAPPSPRPPLVYESHVGMATEEEVVGTYDEFRSRILPGIVDAGYNTVQLMAIMEHPYYGSFGYHVSNFFAASSRFGTPEDLKALIDEAHGLGLRVIMDLVHSHAVKNEIEGLSRFDGTLFQYFHEGDRGYHSAWDSRCFDYGKPEVLHFLLSNCRYWLDEFKVDGFRFDGITSMLYFDHGFGPPFNSYDRYFDESVDEDALAYLVLANKLVHSLRPDAITIAEDVSGMPGLGSAIEDNGCGFDYRLAMGIPDCWFHHLKSVPDEDWSMSGIWHELNNRRRDEQTISYVESHDQAIVGGKTTVFELMDKEMYDHMSINDNNMTVDRGMALHKMIRLATIATCGHGYLTFMGNEFGHPEWIDFPRAENNWSYHYARRQWSLRDNQDLKYGCLALFDRAMLDLAASYHIHGSPAASLLMLDESEKLLVFRRNALVFAFNFNPARSFTDHPVEVRPGKYRLLFSTDDTRFGGHGRLTAHQEYLSEPIREEKTVKNIIRIYIPCRSAIVMSFSH